MNRLQGTHVHIYDTYYAFSYICNTHVRTSTAPLGTVGPSYTTGWSRGSIWMGLADGSGRVIEVCKINQLCCRMACLLGRSKSIIVLSRREHRTCLAQRRWRPAAAWSSQRAWCVGVGGMISLRSSMPHYHVAGRRFDAPLTIMHCDHQYAPRGVSSRRQEGRGGRQEGHQERRRNQGAHHGWLMLAEVVARVSVLYEMSGSGCRQTRERLTLHVGRPTLPDAWQRVASNFHRMEGPRSIEACLWMFAGSVCVAGPCQISGRKIRMRHF